MGSRARLSEAQALLGSLNRNHLCTHLVTREVRVPASVHRGFKHVTSPLDKGDGAIKEKIYAAFDGGMTLVL